MSLSKMPIGGSELSERRDAPTPRVRVRTECSFSTDRRSKSWPLYKSARIPPIVICRAGLNRISASPTHHRRAIARKPERKGWACGEWSRNLINAGDNRPRNAIDRESGGRSSEHSRIYLISPTRHIPGAVGTWNILRYWPSRLRDNRQSCSSRDRRSRMSAVEPDHRVFSDRGAYASSEPSNIIAEHFRIALANSWKRLVASPLTRRSGWLSRAP
jgi:hypothetical protein